MFKRVFLFLITNLAVILVISIILKIFDVQPYLTQYGIDYKTLLIYALAVGFVGSFISLFSSKFMAMQAFNIQLINKPSNESESWLIKKVAALSKETNIDMPDVGIYESTEPNAFATGWNKNKALVAISTGLLESMNPDEIEAVLGHEISHVSNGDMVTLALIQGIVNTFVIFIAKLAAIVLTGMFRKNEDPQQSNGAVYYGVASFLQLILGIFASMIVLWF